MQSAVYNGIINRNQTDIPLICPTGNCTWPIIPSLAVCGSCADLTANITRICSTDYCNYTLPNGLVLDGRATPITITGSQSRRNLFRLVNPILQSPYSRGWSNQIPAAPYYLSVFQSIGTTWPNLNLTTVRAAECALYMCIQAYNVTTKKGNSTVQVVATHTSAVADDQQDTFNYTFNSIPYSKFNIPSSHNYGIAKISLEAMSDTVNSFTFGSVQATQEPKVAGVPDSWTYNFSSPTTAAFWLASTSIHDYTAFVGDISKSMTNSIRLTAPAANDPMYMGVAMALRPYVYIRWAWITYPAAMVVLCPIFLILTVVQTRRRKVNVWKTGATAILFSTVQDQSGRLGGIMNEDSEGGERLLDALKHVEVEVLSNEHNEKNEFWKFVVH